MLEPVPALGDLVLDDPVPVLGDSVPVPGVLEPVPVTGALGSSSRLPGLMSAGEGACPVGAVVGSASAPAEKASITAKNGTASRPRKLGGRLEGGIIHLGCAETNARPP